MRLKKICSYFFGLTIVKVGSIYSYITIKSNKSNKFNLVFDLDETLIHTEKISNYSEYNKSNLLKPEPSEITNRYIWTRPFVSSILPILSKFNNIYLFTKATKPYTDEILSKTNLDQYIKEKKYREDCKNTCKDLNKFLINLDSSLLIDDKISNSCDGQKFYHIPRFNLYVQKDYEFVKLFYYVLWLNIKNDLTNYNK